VSVKKPLPVWLARYARVSPGAAAYLAFRCLGFPHFRRVEVELPKHGRLLDAGCGHGLLAILAADGEPGRDVLGIDLLEDRLGVGREIARRNGLFNVRFERGEIAEPPPGPFDAIVLADVLLYRPLSEQRAVLEALAGRLAAGGALLVKEQVAEPRWKARLVAWQERLVVGAKVRLGGSREWASIAPAGFHLWSAGDLEAQLRSLGLATTSRRLDRFSYLSHRLFIAVAPGMPPKPTGQVPPA
jgi:SAM-dependent methyltransferase